MSGADIERLIAEIEAGLEGVTPGPWEANQSASRHYLDSVEFRYLRGNKGTVALVGRDSAEVGASEVDEQNANSAHIARCSPDNIRAIIDDWRRMRAELASITKAESALVSPAAPAPDLVREMAEALEPLASLPVGPEIAEDRAHVLYKNAGRSITVGDVLDARAALAAGERDGR